MLIGDKRPDPYIRADLRRPIAADTAAGTKPHMPRAIFNYGRYRITPQAVLHSKIDEALPIVATHARSRHARPVRSGAKPQITLPVLCYRPYFDFLARFNIF